VSRLCTARQRRELQIDYEDDDENEDEFGRRDSVQRRRNPIDRPDKTAEPRRPQRIKGLRFEKSC
jgi:hypothetical protein